MAEAPPRGRALARWVLGLAALAAVLLAGRELAALLPALAARVATLGPLAPLVFVAAYALAAVAFVPGSVLSLAAGALFGLRLGIPVVFAGATLGGSIAFLLARTVARARVARAVAGDPRFTALDRAIGADGRRMVFLLRLSPVVPFNILNYALGLTTVRFVDYLVASVGMLPGTVLYVYYGKVAGDVAALAGGAAPPRGMAHYLVLGVGLAATVAVTVRVSRLARRALATTGV